MVSVALADSAYEKDDIYTSFNNSVLYQMGYKNLYVSDYYDKKTTFMDNDVVAYSVSDKYVR